MGFVCLFKLRLMPCFVSRLMLYLIWAKCVEVVFCLLKHCLEGGGLKSLTSLSAEGSIQPRMGGTRGEDGAVRGGRSWFVVESKSFEILVEDLGGKLKGCIWERSRGVSSWIRFGEVSLRCLLEGVEACCREVDNRSWVIGWEEGSRKYRLERRLNEAGRFILCSIRDLE